MYCIYLYLKTSVKVFHKHTHKHFFFLIGKTVKLSKEWSKIIKIKLGNPLYNSMWKRLFVNLIKMLCHSIILKYSGMIESIITHLTE